MGKEYRKLVVEKARGKLKMRIFKELGWIGLLFSWFLSSGFIYIWFPLELKSILIGSIIPIIYMVVLYLKWVYLDVPEEIYDGQKKIIEKYQYDELKLDFISLLPSFLNENFRYLLSV